MFEKLRSRNFASALSDPGPSRRDRIRKLTKLREDAYAERRHATESAAAASGSGPETDLRGIGLGVSLILRENGGASIS